VEFLREAVRHRLIDERTLRERLAETDLDDVKRPLVAGLIAQAIRAGNT